MADLTLTGLRVVVEVARTGSFSAAAHQLGYTQSAVSRQIAASERATGTALFERHARGIRPTTAGEVLIRHAGRVLESVSAAGQELAGLRDRLAGRLTVGGFPAASAVLLPRASARLLRAHPGLQIQLTESATPAQLQALRRGRLEVAVAVTGDGLPDYDFSALRRTELRSGRGLGVAVAEAHPFAGRTWVEPAELAEQPWIVGVRVGDHPEFGTWPGLADAKIAFAVRTWPTRLGLVAAGLGISMVPGFAAGALPSGVRWIPVRDENGGSRHALWAVTGEGSGPAAAAMVRALEVEAASMT
ncbi:LysR family transcriptional regulator [Amycolatopsis jejuensis]|uniref:LysR family transcriptional regulator n=1 Tax=Amycolatopsis jejuensis TaxID=330084 RepID=UPI000524DD3F|nr:LysR family transcriptional regulator [Amycolatopsis jejuensis]